ncbi:Hypothetical protein CINCED_3A009864 [Cinara cedri]|uniref:Uncharacterized protein n=1 Tax=Cinara cedri TaxID=506608 RepID=A0A5E4NMT6_9HEMI|nr:Hypothetical protein CINCED_3A009864 [Cinara cedri]
MGPLREIVDLKRKNLDLAKEFQPFVPKEGNLKYVNPTNYKDFLICIVQADGINLKNKLDKCLAISLRVDRSVDRTQWLEELIEKQLVYSNTEDSVQIITLHNIELQDKMLQTRKKIIHNLHVSDSHSFKVICHDAIQQILTCINKHLDTSALLEPEYLRTKPHSADVERLTSCCNIMKTLRRSSLTSETIKDSLYIQINKVTVNNFNSQPAVLI